MSTLGGKAGNGCMTSAAKRKGAETVACALMKGLSTRSPGESLIHGQNGRVYPPAQNQYMQEKILGELFFSRMHAGPAFALARIQENILEE